MDISSQTSHTTLGGPGRPVAEILAGHGGGRTLIGLGLEDLWSASGPGDFLLDKYGVSPQRVADAVAGRLGRLTAARADAVQ